MISEALKAARDYYNTGIEVRQVSIHKLIVTQGYQRKDLNRANINKIVKEFDPRRLGVLTVSYRKGKYYVIDGQHRLVALMTLFDDDDFIVRCEIQHKHTYRSEAHVFVNQDDGKTRISPFQKFNAEMEEGVEDALAINQIATLCQLKIPTANTLKGDNVIRCIDKLRSIYSKRGGDSLHEVLWLIVRTWGGAEASLKNQIVSGVALFCETYDGDYSDKIFIKALANANPDKIISEGRDDQSAEGGVKFAKVLLRKYNGATIKAKLPYRFNG